MRWFRVFSVLGWAVAILAICACVGLVWMLRESRIKQRLTAVELMPRSATRLPENWDSGKHRVLLVGDSRIKRWEVLPQNPDFVFATSGIGGETTGQLERRFKRDVLDITPPPDEIILAAGINDLVAASLQSDFTQTYHDWISRVALERLQRLANLAEGQGIKVRIATIIQPASPDLVRRLIFWDNSLYRLVSEMNAKIQSLEGHIDFNAMLEGGDGPLPDRFSYDTLHFNFTAYTAINTKIIEEYTSR